MRNFLLKIVLAFAISLPAMSGLADEEVGLRLPPGFEVSLYADDELASDIFSMTFDSLGRVVVSGRGYVRILVDLDEDGIADSAIEYVDGPASGAQGLAFDGRDLICTGDQGLIRYIDRDGDDRADGPAEVLLAAEAGGEHELHAIRKGPDGWWYLMAGNTSGISEKHITLAGSPVKKPVQGTVLRLSPDFSQCEVIADGFRNAYDFDFNSSGDLFTYDSDGERDVSLPWYRPTRVFQVLPGANAGWLSRHWKRPAGFLDMPPVVAAFGRGSPTGVVCYKHTQFPERYRDALFVLDWTYGRVMAVPLSQDGSVWKSEPEKFITAVGQFGFAPTDVAVAPDGSLFVCVGGRGTRGGVYRVRWKTEDKTSAKKDVLAKCLDAPQPLSSWSRLEWEPLVEQIGETGFREAAVEKDLSISQRMRAIEILTEKFGGLDGEAAARLMQENSAALRSRLAWSIGASEKPTDPELLKLLLRDESPLVVRYALEVLVGQPSSVVDSFAEVLSGLLAHDDFYVRQTAVRVAANASNLIQSKSKNSSDAWVRTKRENGFSTAGVEIGLRILGSNASDDQKYEALRAVQIALGDVGPNSGVIPVFESYTCFADLQPHSKVIEAAVEVLEKVYPAQDSKLNHELGRLLAMLQPADVQLLEKVLGQITADSDAVDDIHHLIVAARLPGQRRAATRQQIAAALVGSESKIESAKLRRDSNWDDRIAEMTAAHIQHDPMLTEAILKQPELGKPGHVSLVQSFEGDFFERAVDRFVARIRNDEDYAWSNELVQWLGKSKRSEIRGLLRQQVEDFSVRASILSVLASSPKQQDRALFAAGLDSDDVGMLNDLASALEKLPGSTDAAEQVSLVRTLRRLGSISEERRVQDRIVRILQNNSGLSYGYKLGLPSKERQADAIAKWTAWAEREFPAEWASQTGGTVQSTEDLKGLLEGVDWTAGNSERGELLFRKRACAGCHGGRRSLGPDLTGVAGRFSREDLFQAIANPSRDVSPRYQTTMIATDEGRIYTGRVIYGSVDGLVFRTATNETLRIETDDIVEQRQLSTSLMPTGLLKDFKPSDLADLYAFLQTLGEREPK